MPFHFLNTDISQKKVTKLDESASNELQADITFRGITYREAEYIFGMKNVPAFKEEEFTAYPLDHYKGINFQLSKITKLDGTVENIISTWPALCSDLMKDERFGRYISRCESEAKKLLSTLGLDNKTPMEKLQAITEYVKQNYNWTGVESKYSSGKVSDFMTSRTGTSGDINLFLIGMLKAAKLYVHPFCNVQIKENRFKQTTRTLPIDILFPYSNSYISHIEIPEGYKVEYHPSELTNNNALLGVTYSAQANEKTITINASYAFKKNIYEATDYTLLKRSMGEVIDKFADMIILVKK